MVIWGECLNCDADQCTGEVKLGKGGAILNFFGWATGGYILLQVFAGVRVCGGSICPHLELFKYHLVKITSVPWSHENKFQKFTLVIKHFGVK